MSATIIPPYVIGDFLEISNTHTVALKRLIVGVEPISEGLLIDLSQRYQMD